MKWLSFFIVTLLLASCNAQKPDEPFVAASSSAVSLINDVVIYQGNRFTGYLFQLAPNQKDTLSLARYKDGLLDGVSKKWFKNKQLMEQREFKLGQKNGLQIAFWENGNKRFEFIAKADAYEGELKEWTVDGSLFHLANFVNGQEEGVQKLWYENGKIRANYVVIKGRRYGLLGTKNCKNVSDSIFVVK
jgi:antitoxin component YwqK of YwqJK toxin-antitoxin module